MEGATLGSKGAHRKDDLERSTGVTAVHGASVAHTLRQC